MWGKQLNHTAWQLKTKYAPRGSTKKPCFNQKHSFLAATSLRQINNYLALHQIDFIFSGEQHSGCPVLRGSDVITLRNSSRNSSRLPGIMR
jgi:hypothetical protein